MSREFDFCPAGGRVPERNRSVVVPLVHFLRRHPGLVRQLSFWGCSLPQQDDGAMEMLRRHFGPEQEQHPSMARLQRVQVVSFRDGRATELLPLFANPHHHHKNGVSISAALHMVERNDLPRFGQDTGSDCPALHRTAPHRITPFQSSHMLQPNSLHIAKLHCNSFELKAAIPH